MMKQCIEFVRTFTSVGRNELLPVTGSQPKPPVELGRSFSPLCLTATLRKFARIGDGSKGQGCMGQQQDAEEFLCFLLDGLHEELQKFTGTSDQQHQDEGGEGLDGGEGLEDGAHRGGDDEWEEVVPGGKNKTTLTRRTKFCETPISGVFRGLTRSTLRKGGGAKPSATLQPFHCLQVDIKDLPPAEATLENAIALLSEPEILEDSSAAASSAVDGIGGGGGGAGSSSSGSGKGGAALEPRATMSKHTTLEALPKVLVVHMKRFGYDMHTGSPTKLYTKVKFSHSLKLQCGA